MDYKEFAQTIKQKYPSYQNVDDKELVDRVIAKYPQYQSKLSENTTTTKPIQQQKEPGIIGKSWDALAIPEKMSREGWGMIAERLPEAGESTSVIKNILKGTPRALAEIAGEAAPSFISRSAIVTAGALKAAKPAKALIKAVGRNVGKAAESISGLEYKTPGVLREAFNKPSLITKKGKESAGKMFEKFFDKGQIRPEFAQPMENKQVVEKALEYVGDKTLTPEEALLARRSLDMVKKKISAFGYKVTRDIFDNIAKLKSAEADKAYSQAVKADALRTLFPVNKLGGTSIMKSALGSIAGVAPLTAMSPLVQGTVASGLGVGAKALKPVTKIIDLLAKKPYESGATIASLMKLKKKYDNKRNK